VRKHVVKRQSKTCKERPNIGREQRKVVVVNNQCRQLHLAGAEIACEGVYGRTAVAVLVGSGSSRKRLNGALEMCFEDLAKLPERNQTPLHAVSARGAGVWIGYRLNYKGRRSPRGIQFGSLSGSFGGALKHLPILVWRGRHRCKGVHLATVLRHVHMAGPRVSQGANGLLTSVSLASKVMLKGLSHPAAAFWDEDDV
jgi:hypothetical protein